jgi:signal transduction histidine kinase
LAHELNNPASAIARSASALARSLADVDASARRLGAAGLAPEHIALIESTRDTCLAVGSQSVLSPLEQESRENSIARWLAEHQLDTTPAEAMADTGVTVEILERLARALPRQMLDASIGWIAENAAARRMTAEIQESASRIHNLVDAVKGFTQMDRESVPEPVHIAKGLANTLAVLRPKAKSKAASVTLSADDDLPPVRGFAGELNQVWANLISNALDAVSENGSVEVTAGRECNGVVVRVIDNGPGIPPGIRDRIFDPFFTTKSVGEGSGLGLDIVRRLVQRHNGQIEVDSSPGRTEFRVILP